MRLTNYQLRGNSGGIRTFLCALVVTVLMIGNMVAQGDKQTKGADPSRGVDTSIPTEKTVTNSVGMKFVLIEAGSFQMGSDENDNEKPIHKVTINRPFYMQTTEVTQAQWEAVMGKKPTCFFEGQERPVENVDWRFCKFFIKQLNAKEGTDKYRLPSEAEWEYACRAGCTGDCLDGLDEKAWSGKNSGKETHPVGQKKPNAWGLYDMQGNVWEWCQDWYGREYYSYSPKIDPKGPIGGDDIIIMGRNYGPANVEHGGSWYEESSSYFRCADRKLEFSPSQRSDNHGLRLVRTF